MPTHHETKRLPYTAQQMYDLVADVARYPEFLPWNSAARIRSRKPIEGGEVMEADLVISLQGVPRTLWQPGDAAAGRGEDPDRIPGRPVQIHEIHLDLPPDEGEGGCEIDFFVDFEFRNAILQGIIGLVFNDAMQRVVRAFERRAAALYGPR